MPTYQYACTSCDQQLEAWQSFTDPALTDCPACTGSLRKVFSAVGVVFKGSGFYRNDSRPAESTAGESERSDAKTSGTSDDAKSPPVDGKASGGSEKPNPGASPAKSPGPAPAKSPSTSAA